MVAVYRFLSSARIIMVDSGIRTHDPKKTWSHDPKKTWSVDDAICFEDFVEY